jgi:hypothetical protein
MKHHFGSLLPFSLHFYIQPGHAFSPSGSQGLEKGFFGGEADRKMRNGIPMQIQIF